MATRPKLRIRRSSFAGLLLATALAGCAVSPQAVSPAASATATASARPVQPSLTVTPTTASTAPTESATPTPTSTSTPTVPDTCPTPASGFVRDAPGKGRTVALTFDDGPGEADRQIVQILDRAGIHATFFETGAHTAANPDITRLLAAHGDVIADHTWSHYYPTQVKGGWTRTYLRNQLTRTNRELTSLSGAPVCFFRPPGGFTQNVLSASHALGMSAVLWSVDSEDWKQPPRTTKAATARIVANATAAGGQAHPIVLMHSAKASHEPESVVSSYRGNTVAALPAVIAWYRSHGYRFVTLAGTS